MVIDAGSKTARNILGIAVVTVAGLTMVMNAMYGYKLGRDLEEKITFAAAGVAFDVVKILAIYWVAQAFMKKDFVKGFVGIMLFSGTLAYSLSTATGFALNLRTVSLVETETKIKAIEMLQKEYDRSLSDHTRLAAELEAQKTNVRYVRTSSCSVPENKMADDSKIFCGAYFRLYHKVEAANDLVKDTKVKLAKANAENPNLVVDPLMGFLAKFYQTDVNTVMTIWAIGFAFLIEGVGAFGLYAFSATRMKSVAPTVVQTSDAKKIVYNKDGSIRKKVGRKPKGLQIVVDNSKVA